MEHQFKIGDFILVKNLSGYLMPELDGHYATIKRIRESGQLVVDFEPKGFPKGRDLDRFTWIIGAGDAVPAKIATLTGFYEKLQKRRLR